MDLIVIRNELIDYLEKSADGLGPGRFHFCLDGSLVPTVGTAAQVSTCFASKAAWQAGIWDTWPTERKHGCIAFMKSFQTAEGCFSDPWLKRASKPNIKRLIKLILSSLVKKVSWREIFEVSIRNLRAETRQAVSTLFMVNELPRFPLPMEYTTVEEIRAFLKRLDWQNPWAAGSHLSHLMFFLSTNYVQHKNLDNYEQLIDFILNFLSSIHDPITGCWFKENPKDVIKINGAMKILSGLQWIERPYPDCTRLLDFALEQPFQSDGCGFLNRLFVVHEAKKGVQNGYRRDEIRGLAMKALHVVGGFRKPDGGFSFFDTHSQTHYYGARVSKGQPVSDLHGTAMMLWAIALAVELLGDDAPIGSEFWRAHRT